MIKREPLIFLRLKVFARLILLHARETCHVGQACGGSRQLLIDLHFDLGRSCLRGLEVLVYLPITHHMIALITNGKYVLLVL